MGRVDGIHFPTGQDMSTGLLQVLDPNSTVIMNEPEARWHYATMRAKFPDLQLIWRASPDVKPAQSHWDAHVYSREIFKSLDFHADHNNGQYPLDVLLLNELNLDYERGEDHHDGGAFDTNPANWPSLYRGLSTFLGNLLVACRERFKDRGVSPRIWFPAWAPGHGEQFVEQATYWVYAAQDFDGICLHSYRDAGTITNDVLWYANHFPDKPLLLGEWNADNFPGDRIQEEIAIRTKLRELAVDRPNLSACYFIWAWAQDNQRKSYDIDGNPERLKVWDGTYMIPDPVKPPEEHPVPTPPSLPRGIDIASYQGYPNWAQVKASGVEFAFIKATDGTTYVNPTFVPNWAEAKQAGVYRATYHFARPDLNAPSEEAEFFWETVKNVGVEPGDVFALDLEDLNGSFSKASMPVANWALAFLSHFQDLAGFRPLLYVSPWVIQEQGLTDPAFAEFGLWLASWGSQFPEAPAPWDLVAVWQSSDNATIPGIAGPVDEDFYNGPIDSFPRYGYPGAPVVVPPDPTPVSDLAALQTKLGYATHDVADALQKEADTLRASVDALQAAIDELRRQG